MYAPRTHPVFNLVPPSFGQLAEGFYAQMGHPSINRESVWRVYLDLRAHFYALEDSLELEKSRGEWGEHLTAARVAEEARARNEPEIELIPNLQELSGGEASANRNIYLGGVNNDNGLGEYMPALMCAWFYANRSIQIQTITVCSIKCWMQMSRRSLILTLRWMMMGITQILLWISSPRTRREVMNGS